MATVTECAIFAGGCFWGMEYWMKRLEGVISVEPGYTGGQEENPTYKQVKAHETGHYEAVRVIFDPEKCSYETVCRHFFEIHDPTQEDGQGIDIGPQYRSAIFYADENQKAISEKTIAILEAKGLSIATKLFPASVFWTAEEYHRDYCDLRHIEPECHVYTKRF